MGGESHVTDRGGTTGVGHWSVRTRPRQRGVEQPLERLRPGHPALPVQDQCLALNDAGRVASGIGDPGRGVVRGARDNIDTAGRGDVVERDTTSEVDRAPYRGAVAL